MDYHGFAVGRLKIDPDKFWNLSFQDFYVLALAYREDIDNELQRFGDLKAHIANFAFGFKKRDGTEWTYKDFVKLSTDVEVKQEKLTLKEAKQLLGSKFELNQN